MADPKKKLTRPCIGCGVPVPVCWHGDTPMCGDPECVRIMDDVEREAEAEARWRAEQDHYGRYRDD